ncbi:25497_t:CDS:2, partial [Dentiscutata erythropus]
ELKQDMLAIKNEIVRMQSDTEWRSEVRSRGQASITSLRSEYSTEIETLWVKFTALFDERRKREKSSPIKIYNTLSIEINLSSATLANFYRHQKTSLKTSLNKIEAWIEKENRKKDNSIIISDSSGGNNKGSESHFPRNGTK